MRDIIVIGKGPAGIQAAIYAKRTGMDVLVIGKGYGALEKAEKIENLFGQEEPVEGKRLVEKGWKQAQALGIEIVTDELVSLEYDNACALQCASGNEYSAHAVIIATGSSRKKAQIAGVEAFDGKGVSYCAICDAFFHKGKSTVVLGSGSFAAHEASILLNVCKSVSILTNGEQFAADVPQGAEVITKKIKELKGANVLEAVMFEDETSLEVSGFFVALGQAGAADIARKVGLETDGRSIIVNENMQTALPAIFAAGDCTGGTLQISHALAKGCTAGLKAAEFVRSKKR